MTMSCPEVVYQAYYPYLYQRPGTAASAVGRTAPFTPFSHQYDRLNVGRTLEHTQQSSTSLDAYHVHHSSHHSSAGSVSSGGGGVGSPGSPPTSVHRHKEEDTAGSSREVVNPDDDDEDEDDTSGGRAQYVSANCVVFTSYSGDVASVVDEHFSRALSYSENKGNSSQTKESSPMSARNFPPSFWNSNYQSSNGMTSHHSSDLYGDPYHPHTGGAGSDPWHSHYQQYTAAAHHHSLSALSRRAVHEYHHHHHNMAAQYSGLLLPPTPRLTAHHPQYTKPEPWGSSSHQRLHEHQTTAHHHLDTAGYSAYPSMAGLEAQVQESSKDLYWF